MTVGTDKDVLGLQVTIDHSCRVQAFDTFDDLRGVESCSIATKAAPTCQLSRKITSGVEVLYSIQTSITVMPSWLV